MHVVMMVLFDTTKILAMIQKEMIMLCHRLFNKLQYATNERVKNTEKKEFIIIV